MKHKSSSYPNTKNEFRKIKIILGWSLNFFPELYKKMFIKFYYKQPFAKPRL